LFDQVMTIGVMTQLEKSVTYAITLVAGFVIYKQFVLKTNLFYKLSLFELDFNGICLSLTGFMVAMMVWLRVFVV